MFNPLDLSGKLFLVTGASSGIGRATATLLSRLGAKLILSGRNTSALEETRQLTENSETHVCKPFDLMRLEHIPAWVEGLVNDAGAPLNGAVHCAGHAFHAPLKALSVAQLQSTLTLNLQSSVMLLKALSARSAVASTGSSIVLISSVAAQTASPAMIAYATSKAGLHALALSAAKELGPKKVRVNCIAPAYVRTPVFDHAATKVPGFEAISARQFLGILEPEEVGTMAAYLLSDAACKVTGSQFVIDGGFTLGG